MFGVTGVLAALRERDSTGLGQRVDSALFESAAFLMASHMTGGAATGAQVPPMTARKGAWGIYDVFHASDGTALFIGVTSDSQWQRFCTQFELHELLADSRLVSNTQRTSEQLMAETQTWIEDRMQEITVVDRFPYQSHSATAA